MVRKQMLWLTGLSAVLCCALVWRSSNTGQDGLGDSAANGAAQALITPVRLAADEADKEQADKPATTTKRKKKVTGKNEGEVEYNKLTPAEAHILLHKGTERAFTGEYTDLKDPGTYICRRCNAPLYHSDTKFESHCGWPSFDDDIKGAVTRRLESDGTGRIEIICNNCGGHLGHVFMGEGYTQKNTRHCVNSKSMRFIAHGKPLPETIKPKRDDPKSKASKDAEDAKAEEGAADRPAASSKAESSQDAGSAKRDN